MSDQIKPLIESTKNLDTTAFLAHVLDKFAGEITLASSLGAEDQVLTDKLLKHNSAAKIFVLDTGRLPQETYDLINDTMKKYNMNYNIYFPDAKAIQEMVSEKGPNLFYESVSNRKLCCHIRKVEPLKRALEGKKAWITGLRKDQSPTRSKIERIEWDEDHNLIKLNPLANWKTEEIWTYIRHNKVPYNKLHDKDYPSIGCAPCTRPIEEGETPRAGRWWWEDPENKECGLHVKDGKLIRIKDFQE